MVIDTLPTRPHHAVSPRAAAPIRAGTLLDADAFYHLRTEMVLDGCKWDPQVGDVTTLSAFPLLITESR